MCVCVELFFSSSTVCRLLSYVTSCLPLKRGGGVCECVLAGLYISRTYKATYYLHTHTHTQLTTFSYSISHTILCLLFTSVWLCVCVCLCIYFCTPKTRWYGSDRRLLLLFLLLLYTYTNTHPHTQTPPTDQDGHALPFSLPPRHMCALCMCVCPYIHTLTTHRLLPVLLVLLFLSLAVAGGKNVHTKER